MNSPSFDLIIIGSGIAGLLTALNSPSKTKILIISKSRLNNCATNLAQGGIAAAINKPDGPAQHIKDTITAGHGINNKKNVEFIINKAPQAIKNLEKFGVKFDKSGTKLKLNMEAAHKHPRIVHVKDHTGLAIETALIQAIKKQKNITIVENCFTKRLLVKNRTCHGIEIITPVKRTNNSAINKNKLIFAKRTIIATGGIGKIYGKTTNPSIATGDGIAMAHNAGCALKDLKYIQFHPTALNINRNPLFLLSETLRGAGATIVNKKGERILFGIHPDMELAPRDIISRALYREKNIFLDLRPIGSKKIKKEFPSIHKKLLTFKLDCTKNTIPIIPAAHYLCGGIKTNLHGETSVKNLFAVGECAYTGLHGANRLASNSLLEAVVISEQISLIPINQLTKHKNPLFKTTQTFAQANNKTKNRTLLNQIQNIMWEYAGIDRTTKSLKQAKKLMNKYKKNIPAPTDIQSTELNNIYTTALLIIEDALNGLNMTNTE